MFLKEISDDLLICLYREKNQDSIDLLFKRYNKFLYGMISDFFNNKSEYIDYEEMYQESMLIFLKCIESYDEENGCFYFFVRKAVERGLIYKYRKLQQYNNIKSLDELYYGDGNESYVDYVVCEDDNSFLKSEIYDVLNEVEIKVLDFKMEGYTYEEIGERLSLSKQAVYRVFAKIKKTLKDIIKN